MAGTLILPIQSAKVFGSFITLPAAIDGGAGAWKLLFDANQTESALWQFRLPENYNSGSGAATPTLKIIYAMASATSNKIDMEVDIMAVSDGDSQDIDSASFDSINEITGGTTVPRTTGYIDEINITLTNRDNMVAGDFILLRLHRDHDDTDDTASGDVEVLAVSVEYPVV